MPLQFENAWGIIAAAAIFAATTVLWVLRKDHSCHWRLVCVLLPGLAAGCVALAISKPTFAFDPAAKNIVIVLDLSSSTLDRPWQNPAWVRNLAQDCLNTDTRLTIVGFGGSAAPRILADDLTPADPARWPADWPTGQFQTRPLSDVAPAIQFRTAAEIQDQLTPAPRWFITDGLLTFPPAEKLPYQLALTTIPSKESDVGIIDLNVSATNEIAAHLAATDKTSATFEIFCDNKLCTRQQVSFDQQATRWITFRDMTPDDKSTPRTYTVIVRRSPTADPWPENDSASITTNPTNQPPRILIVGTIDSLPSLGNARTIPPSQFPLTAATLLSSGIQIIILNDLPLSSVDPATPTLPPHTGKLLDTFVRQTGGGLLILGRRHAFGPGHYPESGTGPDTLEGLSPLASQNNDRPAANIIFLLDASGSMNDVASARVPEQKFRLAARGVEQSLSLVQDQDQITVLTFNDKTTTIAQGTKSSLATANQLRKALDEVRPTGNTNIDSALDSLTRVSASSITKNPPPRMLVLLTDGEIPELNLAKWQSLLKDSATTLTVVAPTPANPTALQTLAKNVNATWLPTDDAAQWPALLKRAVAKETAGPASSETLDWRTVNLPIPLRGAANQSIKVWKKTEARGIVATEATKTLGAIVQRGLGKVAALAIGPDPSTKAYNQLFNQLLVELTPPPGDRRFTLRATRTTDAWRITAEAIDAKQFLNHEALKIRLLNADDSEKLFELPQTGPGKYEALVPPTENLTATIIRQTPAGDELIGKIQPPTVALTEWPASFQQPVLIASPNTVNLPADLHSPVRWQPQLKGYRRPLENYLYFAAAMAALTAVWLRALGTFSLVKLFRRSARR